jgi:hypothetical protein
MGPIDRYCKFCPTANHVLLNADPYCRRLPTVLPGTAAHHYNPAVIQHQAGSHDCRLDAI